MKEFKDIIEKHLQKSSILAESINTSSAIKARTSIQKYFKRFLDSDAIMPLSNFNSFENKEYISLKLSIYGKFKDLEHARQQLENKLKSEGWRLKQKDDVVIYGKDDIFVKLFNFNKVFRSGPYKNRETPHFGIEIIGYKKIAEKRSN